MGHSSEENTTSISLALRLSHEYLSCCFSWLWLFIHLCGIVLWVYFYHRYLIGSLTHFMSLISFDTPLKTLENLWFSDVFRGYQKRSVAWNRLITLANFNNKVNRTSFKDVNGTSGALTVKKNLLWVA